MFCVSGRFPQRLYLSILLLAGVLMLAGSVQAQKTRPPEAIPRKAWEEAVKKHKGSGPPLLIVHPQREMVLYGDQVRFAGCTIPGSQITVNGLEVDLYPNGAFVGMAPIRPGSNTLAFRSTLRGQSTSYEVWVRRPEPLEPVPAEPLLIDESRDLEPSKEAFLLPGDSLLVRFQGSPGGAAWFTIGDSRQRNDMAEKGTGVYVGSHTVETVDDWNDSPVTLHLKGHSGGKDRVVSVVAPGHLTTGVGRVYQTIVTTEDDAGLYTDTSAIYRLTSVSHDVMLQSTGRFSGFCRVLLGADHEVYVKSTSVQVLPEAGPTIDAPVLGGMIREESSDPGTQVLSFPLSWQGVIQTWPPLVILADEQATSVAVSVWGVSGPEFSQDQPGLIRSIHAKTDLGGRWRLHLDLDTDRLWGYEAFFEEARLVVRLRSAPAPGSATERPLLGFKVFLDPGHGGSDPGAIGPAGLREADANLEIALRLADRLRAAGATVLLTRGKDEYVKLDKRVEMIAASGADLLLSIHNNSTPSGSNPLDSAGTISFYYHAHGKDFAREIYDALVAETESPRREKGVRWHAFRPMRRSTQLPSALAEVLFLSHPEDEMRLLDSAYLDSVSLGLYKGLAAFALKDTPLAGTPVPQAVLAAGRSPGAAAGAKSVAVEMKHSDGGKTRVRAGK
ncbi:N-acetylmuramoyl-L-alanine amidase [bacterium]|nr:N-acetylmuramoyl-L-alanine amidase [bacterium]